METMAKNFVTFNFTEVQFDSETGGYMTPWGRPLTEEEHEAFLSQSLSNTQYEF
jgi:hypothetical protein